VLEGWWWVCRPRSAESGVVGKGLPRLSVERFVVVLGLGWGGDVECRALGIGS